MVSVWIALSFYKFQGKRNSLGQIFRRDEEEATKEVRLVDDNSTIFGGSQDLGRSFDSQMTESDDILEQSLSIEAADFDDDYKQDDHSDINDNDCIESANDLNDGIYVLRF